MLDATSVCMALQVAGERSERIEVRKSLLLLDDIEPYL